jgi:hypothetical protein
MKLETVQREYLAGAQRLVADREDGALKHEPVVIDAAPPRVFSMHQILRSRRG